MERKQEEIFLENHAIFYYAFKNEHALVFWI